ncbi:helix-turn-helix transcriptional regulator [Marinobacter nauticus]|uniref:helix-turn-helix transcriptional regulator n=1 Tax=Marinobacter nauticus TaxID=2743 RepID=UPI004043CBF7
MSNARQPASNIERFLRYREVEKVTGFRRSTIYLWMSQGKFPRPIKIQRAVAWKLSDIENWMEQQGEERA